ncbi:GNAT family N-acetyltransferase [Halobacteriales archaeon QS_4_62_28]|nr:MAG: GNAT family N-acetyltransferase [Halobacteriales archaeon QS_4_62_28]
MSIEIRRADESDIEGWNSHVSRSHQGTVFHRFEALGVLADHADATVHPLMGFKGQEPVGIFPLFEMKKGPVRMAFSPPPNMRVSYLGPAMLNLSKLKQRKRDRRRKRFIEECLEWLTDEVNPKYAHTRMHGGYEDVRPFKWNDWSVDPSYTYVVDLDTDAESLLMRFSSDGRSNIRNADEDSYTIEVGKQRAIELIVEQVRNRYESQGISYGLTADFVTDLYEALPDGSLKPYVFRVDDEFVGGMLVPDSGETVSRWQGGVRTDTDIDLPVNDLLDWRVMQDGIDGGRSAYDLVGAEDERINEYKAKFNPQLQTYYSATHSEAGMSVLASMYQRFRGQNPLLAIKK